MPAGFGERSARANWIVAAIETTAVIVMAAWTWYLRKVDDDLAELTED